MRNSMVDIKNRVLSKNKSKDNNNEMNKLKEENENLKTQIDLLNKELIFKKEEYDYIRKNFSEIHEHNLLLENKIKNITTIPEEKTLSKQEQENISTIKSENIALKKELDSIKQKTGGNFFNAFHDTYGIAFHFCYEEYLDYYFRDDFEDIFKEITEMFDETNKNKFKWFYLRTLFVNLLRRNTLFLDSELENQKKMDDEKNVASEFKFKGNAGYHPSDLGLSDSDRTFIKDKDIIDAGAYIGDTSLPFSKLTNKKVWAFEPFSETYDLLVENVKLNNVNNVVPVKKSLGNINGEKSLFLTGNDFSGITSKPENRYEDSWEEIKVQECTVDAFVEEKNLDVGYINVDVEGGELDLLEGAKNTIIRQKPILGISIYHQAKDFFEIIPWINNLNLGYEFKLFKENPKYFLQETMVIAKVK